MATLEQLDRVMLWGAHILIAHRDVTPGVVSFRLPEWTPSPAVPSRTRREAFERANTVAALAALHPEQFALLARTYSDDISTKDWGGSFFGTTAYQLSDWPEMLDAFAALGEGEVSRVVETDYGFHVFLRSPPPPAQRVSASRLVIGYDEAPWLHQFLSRWAVPKRSRSQALTLASQLYEQLRHDPSRFEALVEQYSDHEDAQRRGDFGEWSTREPAPFPREIEIASRLAPGEVSAPFDSPFGVQILQRTPLRSRAALAMETLEVPFDPKLPAAAPGSRENTLEQLARVRRDLPAHPSLFAELRAQQCCSEVVSWTEGQGDPAIEAVLQGLTSGQYSLPIPGRGRASLLRRVPGLPAPAVAVEFNLPTPDGPDLDYWLAGYGSEDMLTEVAARTCARLSLPTSELARLPHQVAAGGGGPLVDLAVVRQQVTAVIGLDGVAAYEFELRRYIEARLMRVTPHPGRPRVLEGMPIRMWPAL